MRSIMTLGLFFVVSLMLIPSVQAQNAIYNGENSSEKVQLLYNSSENKRGYSGGPLSIVGMLRQEKSNAVQGKLEKKKYNPFNFTVGLGVKNGSGGSGGSGGSIQQRRQQRAAESKKYNQERAAKRKALLEKSQKITESSNSEQSTPYRSTYRTGSSANLYRSPSTSRSASRASSPTRTVRSSVSSRASSRSASPSIPSKVFTGY